MRKLVRRCVALGCGVLLALAGLSVAAEPATACIGCDRSTVNVPQPFIRTGPIPVCCQ